MNTLDKNYWLVLKKYYESSKGFLKINDKLLQSIPINISRGVKQGGILSSFMFNIFINDLIKDVLSMNTGLHLDSINYSILSYCDDIILLSTSLRQAQNMVDTCNNYGNRWNLTFNEKKSNILHTGNKIYNNNQINISLNNKKLNVVDSIKYLGLNFTDKINFDDINTVGILNAQGLSDNVKNTVKSKIGEFIKNTGLILDTANITVQDNRVVITSDTIKNPNISTIQSITFDTNEDSPTAQVVSGTVEISSDLITLFQSIMLTYNDNQIGRNGLITATQGKM